jgi:hypothetical protein
MFDFSDEADFRLYGVVNKPNMRAILGIRKSTFDSWEGASCTENYNVGRNIKIMDFLGPIFFGETVNSGEHY